jgi:hypothetical protein
MGGWLHFTQQHAHVDPAVGERGLSVAVVEDGVTIAVVKDGRPQACTISWDDWDLLLQYVELER